MTRPVPEMRPGLSRCKQISRCAPFPFGSGLLWPACTSGTSPRLPRSPCVARWYGAAWFGTLRWIALGAAAVLTFPFFMYVLMYAVQSFEAARRWRTLDHAETVADVALPARSRIRFADMAHTKFISVDLSDVTDILGVRFTGQLTRYDTWMMSDGLERYACRGPGCERHPLPRRLFHVRQVRHHPRHQRHGAQIRACRTPMKFFGLNFPPGTSVRRGNANRRWRFLLPADRGVFVRSLPPRRPGGVTLEIADDGRLDNIGSGHGQIITVRGPALNSMHSACGATRSISELAEPSAIDGKTWPAGTDVVIDLATGEVARHHP